MERERILAIGMVSGLWLAMYGCSEDRIEDERSLDTLSSSELGELCDELTQSWPNADQRVECSDGSSVSFQRAPGASCGQADLSLCPATAGDLRACTQAFVDDPCTASVELPSACRALQQEGCAAEATPELALSCTPLAASELTPFEGIYEFVSRTGNGACDAEGLSPLAGEGDRFLVVVAAELFGAPVGSLQSCTDIADCRATVARVREQASNPGVQPLDGSADVPELSRAIFCKAESAGALLSQQFTVGSPRDGACALSQTDTTVARGADGSLRLESRTFDWEKPADGDACSYRAGEKPETAPCSALEVREARFVSSL